MAHEAQDHSKVMTMQRETPMVGIWHPAPNEEPGYSTDHFELDGDPEHEDANHRQAREEYPTGIKEENDKDSIPMPTPQPPASANQELVEDTKLPGNHPKGYPRCN